MKQINTLYFSFFGPRAGESQETGYNPFYRGGGSHGAGPRKVPGGVDFQIEGWGKSDMSGEGSRWDGISCCSEGQRGLGTWRIGTCFILIFLFTLTLPSFAQKEKTLIKKGNALYDQGKYKDAEMNYRKALDANKSSAGGLFNLGDAVYQQKNYDESSKIFGNLAGSSLSSANKASVYHNLGNSLLEAKDYEKSIEAYKHALVNNPSDNDTKYNLEYAKEMIKKQQQQQKQQQQNQDKQNKDKKDQKKNDQNKDQQNQKQQQKQDQQDQSKKISKEDADRMLEAMKKDETKTQQKLKKEKAKVQQVMIEKDW